MFVLPFNRESFYKKPPFAVIGLTIINTALLAATYSSSQAIFLKYGFVPADPHWLTSFTSMFLHAGFWHLAGNMFFLWMFGGQLENRLGSILFLLLYLASGLGGDGLQYLMNPGMNIPTVGASGAISGVVGAYFIFFPRSRFDLDFYLGWWRVKTIRTRTHAAVGVWFAEQFLLGLISQIWRASAVAFWAHVGGFILGAAAAGVLQFVLPAGPTVKSPVSKNQWEEAGDDEEESRVKDHLTTLKL